MALNLAAVLCILYACSAASIQEQSRGRISVTMRTLDHNVTALRLVENRLLAGTSNALYSYGLDMQLENKIDLPSETSTIQSCMEEFLPNCDNYVKVIQPVPSSNKILVCGTNAFHPKCSLHYKDQLDNFTRSPDGVESGFSPDGSNNPIHDVVASNQRFFSATVFKNNLGIGMSPNPLQPDRRVNVTVSSKADNLRLDLSATFTAVHEYRDHIYFFLTESASSFELGNTVSDTSVKPLFSKVIRICKSDNGIDSMTFSTFQKARIECSNRIGTSATYIYNEVAATFMGSENGEAVLYATFNAPRNGPTGGAICKYSFSSDAAGSLTNVFENGQYYVYDDAMSTWKQVTGPKVNCSSDGAPRSRDAADKYIFAFNAVTTVQDSASSDSLRPLVRVDGEVLGKIAAEQLMYKGERQEVLYYSNHLGQIKQIVLASEKSYNYSLLEEVDMGDDNRYEAVQSIHLRRESSGYGSSLYINRGRRIIKITRGSCRHYTSCQDCMESRDLYCGWHSGTSSCRNKIEHPNVDLIESFSATESDLANTCGVIVQPSPTSAATLVYSQISPKLGSGDTTDPSSTWSSPSGAAIANSPPTINIPAIIGSAIGTFILGLFLGLLICFVFFLRIQIINKRQTYQVQDKSKSNNVRQDGTLPDTIVDIKSITSTETKEIYRSNTITTPRYVEHALPQQVQPRLPDPEVKTNIIEVGNTALQNSNVMDASPVKVGNGHVVSVSASSQPVTAETGSSSESANNTGKVNSVPSMPTTPRVTDASQNSRISRPAPTPPVRFAVGSSNTLPHNRHANKAEASRFNFNSTADNSDDAFAAETDTVPPLVSVSTKYNSLGRTKSGGTNHGMARRQVPNYKVPKGRTDSTTWLRQESVSSDISPLQSPISDV